MYSWYPPDVLMVSPRCTEHPPMYWTSPDVLNTHYTGWLSTPNWYQTPVLKPIISSNNFTKRGVRYKKCILSIRDGRTFILIDSIPWEKDCQNVLECRTMVDTWWQKFYRIQFWEKSTSKIYLLPLPDRTNKVSHRWPSFKFTFENEVLETKWWTKTTLVLQQMYFSWMQDKFYWLKEVLQQILIFIEDQLTGLNKVVFVAIVWTTFMAANIFTSPISLTAFMSQMSSSWLSLYLSYSL